ncbi:MAG: hypothetical protein ACKOW3_04380 [Hyphomicrobium sp.]
MSKEETGQGKDQEFAFSKYAEKKDLSTGYSDFRAQDLDLKNHQVGYVPVPSSVSQYSQLSQAEEATTKNAQIDISDLKIMREQLNKILELPEYDSKKSKEETFTQGQGLGDMSFFKGTADQKTAIFKSAPIVKRNEEPVFRKYNSPENKTSYQDLKEAPLNFASEWNSSDAELLARSYEKEEAYKSNYSSQTNALAYNSTSHHAFRSTSRQTSSLYNSQAIAEAIADQKWLNHNASSGEAKPNSAPKTSVKSSDSGERAKAQLEVFWQRMNVVLRDLALQTKAQTKQLFDAHNEETVLHYEKLEQQISVLQDLLRKVHTSIEKFDPKSQISSSDDRRQIKEQDLNSVLFSIDEDLSHTFGFKQQKFSYNKPSSDLDQKVLTDRQYLPFAYNDHVALKLDNLQKILLRLLDRLELPPDPNAMQNISSQVTNKKKLSKPSNGLLSTFKLSWRKIFSVPRTVDGSSPSKFGGLSNVSRRQKSSYFGVQKNSSLTIIALFFVIALSSASLVMNSSKTSFANRNSSIQALTSSESAADAFYNANQARVPFITNSAPKQLIDENESNESSFVPSVPDVPSVSEEFLGMGIVPSGHF